MTVQASIITVHFGTITGTNGIGSGLFTSVITVKLDNGHTVMIEKKESDKYKYEAVEEEKEIEVKIKMEL